MRRRKRIGARRITALRHARDRAVQRRRDVRLPGRRRKILGRRAERARPWLQFLADLASIVARLVT